MDTRSISMSKANSGSSRKILMTSATDARATWISKTPNRSQKPVMVPGCLSEILLITFSASIFAFLGGDNLIIEMRFFRHELRGRRSPGVLDLVLKFQDRLQDSLGPRRASRDINIHRDHLVDPLHRAVVVVEAAGGGADPHGDDPLGLAHLFVDLFEDGRLLEGDGTGDEQEIRLTGRKTDQFGPETGKVKYRGHHAHELNGAASGAEGHGP